MILVIGESGTGKSTSLENLNPQETFIFQSIGKPLPFRGWRRNYKPYSADGKSGNLVITDQSALIVATLKEINTNRPEIKNIIIDDFQYVMSNEFMRRTKEKGFDKFNDIGHNAWAIVNALNLMRQDVTSVVLAHSEQSDLGKTKLKTLGKMLDDKVVIEGMFTAVLQSLIFDGRYLFVTQNNGQNTCKSPKGLFESDTIDNDLNEVISAYVQYQNADLEELKADMIDEIEKAQTEGELIAIFKRYPEFKSDEMMRGLIASRKDKLSKPKVHVPTGIDPETYDRELFLECNAEAQKIEGQATDGKVSRLKVDTTTHELYKKRLAERLNASK